MSQLRVLTCCALTTLTLLLHQAGAGVTAPTTRPSVFSPVAVTDIPLVEPEANFAIEVISRENKSPAMPRAMSIPPDLQTTQTSIPLPVAAFGGSLVITFLVARRGKKMICGK